jgi:uncharacterized protein (TIGR03437 family)
VLIPQLFNDQLLRYGEDGIAMLGSRTSLIADKLFFFRSPIAAAPPVFTENSLVNAASLRQGLVAPGEIVTIYGNGLGPDYNLGPEIRSGGKVSDELADVRVLFDGVPAPILFANEGQLNVIAPQAVAKQRSTKVQVANMTILSQEITLPTSNSSPGLFTLNAAGFGTVVAMNEDGNINGPAQGAQPGSVVVLWATGLGQLRSVLSDGEISTAANETADSVEVQIGGLKAQVLYAGSAPGMVNGVFQINVRIPDAVARDQAAALSLRVGSASIEQNVSVQIAP